jgi:PilZ domain
MDELGIKERRKFSRFPLKVLLRYFNFDLLREEARAQSYDVSAKGICLITRDVLPVNTLLDIWLEMPDNGDKKYVKGKVIWYAMIEHDKYRIGIDLEDAELNPISLVLKSIQVRIKNH